MEIQQFKIACDHTDDSGDPCTAGLANSALSKWIDGVNSAFDLGLDQAKLEKLLPKIKKVDRSIHMEDTIKCIDAIIHEVEECIKDDD